MSLETILNDLKKDVKIFGSVLIHDSGIPIATDLPQNMPLDKEKISMIFAAVLLTSEQGVVDNNFGNLDRVSIRGEKGEMFLFRVKEDLLLCILAPRDISYGILILSVKNAINRLTSVELEK
ncbi:MAG: roadblock/LC7 domain-containing protein [Candidatus Hodarchaeota archaeon]